MFIDPSAKGLAEEIKRVCPEVIIRDAENTVDLGISRVQKLLVFERLLLCPEQKELENEMYMYSYDPDSIEKGLEKPIKDNDHCITGDTLIDTIQGQVPIKELVGTKGKVYCYDTKRKRKVISRFYKVRKTIDNARVFELKLKTGEIINATENHLFYTQRGWVMLKDLKNEDKIYRMTS